MLWGRYDHDLLRFYIAVDQAIGRAMEKAPRDTTLTILSDHGFAKFDRAVHLNTWLLRQGFLTLDDPGNAGSGELFEHVNWAKTQAYSLGLNALYLNLQGREAGGVVVPGRDSEAVLKNITERLQTFRDPDTGDPVVERIYASSSFHGHNVRYAPDLIVGYRRGYRSSWQTALGAVPAVVIENNTDAWIGDHCMAAESVPGVFLSNRKARIRNLQIYDIPVTILSEFGIPAGEGMIGRAVF